MDRFWAKVDKTEECWNWRASKDRYGYGQFYLNGKNLRAHRVGFMLQGGVLTDQDNIDHICNNRSCVRKDLNHCIVSTTRTNILRSITNPIAINSRKTHCNWGHEFTPENTYIYITRKGHEERKCKECIKLK